MSKTYIIIVSDGFGRPDVATETAIGFAFRDAVESIWDGDYRDVEAVHCWTRNGKIGSTEDVSRDVARDLGKRSFAEGETPTWVEAFCAPLDIETFDEDRHEPMLRHPNAGLSLGASQLEVGR